MSAAVYVLPHVWAMGQVAAAATELRAVTERKAPQALRLVHASAGLPVAEMPRRAVAAVPKPELAFYRKHTEGLLRRYVKLSLEAGRVPSMLGREMFRGHVTSYRVKSFEDVVIFVHDTERCLDLLTKGQQHLVRRIALQEYTQGETAAMLGMSLRTVVRRYAEAIDALTRTLLERGLLEVMGGDWS